MQLSAGLAESQADSKKLTTNVVTGVAAVQKAKTEHKSIGKRKVDPKIISPVFQRSDGAKLIVCCNLITR